MAGISRGLILSISCFILLIAYIWSIDSWSGGNTILVILLILSLVTNITILISNSKKIEKEYHHSDTDVNSIKLANNHDSIENEPLPDPLERGFDLPI